MDIEDGYVDAVDSVTIGDVVGVTVVEGLFDRVKGIGVLWVFAVRLCELSFSEAAIACRFSIICSLDVVVTLFMLFDIRPFKFLPIGPSGRFPLGN